MSTVRTGGDAEFRRTSVPAPPLVTIAVPTFNRAHMIRRTLDSAVGQSYSRLEILVSDDASTDGTETVCQEYADRDPRVRYIRQTSNLGPERNVRFLLQEARGQYFAWLSDDNYFDPSFVEQAVQVLEQERDVTLCFCDYWFVNEENRITGEWRLEHLYPDTDWREGQIDFFRYPFSRSTVAICGLYRTSVLRKVGDPRPSTFRRILSGHEAPFLARIAARGRVVALPETLFYYMEHSLHNRSLAHTVSRSLKRWELALLYATLQAKILGAALAARAPLPQRLRLARACLGASLKKLGRGRFGGPPTVARELRHHRRAPPTPPTP